LRRGAQNKQTTALVQASGERPPSVRDFVKSLLGSSAAVFRVAERLHYWGHEVKIPPLRYPEDGSQWEHFIDSGDIFIGDNLDEAIEVKQMRFDFTCADDYPHFNMIVANKDAIDRKPKMPKAWWIVSNNLKHAAIIDIKTRPDWFVRNEFAKNTQKIEPFYMLPKTIPVYTELPNG